MVERRRAGNIHQARGEGAEELCGGEAGASCCQETNLQRATLPLTT